MPKLTKKAILFGRTDPNYGKASLLKIKSWNMHSYTYVPTIIIAFYGYNLLDIITEFLPSNFPIL